MAETYKILGQIAATATTTHNVYTVPANTQAVISSIVVVNRNNNANCTYRVAAQQAGAALANQHYLAYDSILPANDGIVLTLGITLAATDVVTVYASTANVAFSLFGVEIT